jgi:hypothetical protein
MATCGNCRTKLGCSCKARKASDGKSCCVSCIAQYEKVLKYNKKQEANKKPSNGTEPGVILSATAVQKE